MLLSGMRGSLSTLEKRLKFVAKLYDCSTDMFRTSHLLDALRRGEI
jgi:hypothetical protein